MKHTPIWAKEYLHDELKKNISQGSKRFNELVGTYAPLYNSKEPAKLDINETQRCSE